MFVKIRGLLKPVIKLRNAIALCLVCTQPFICATQIQLLRPPEENEHDERVQKQRVLRNDIQRLLSESDWHQGESFMRNRTLFNTTLIGNENYTSYWHLSADAPVSETLDAAQRIAVPKFIEGKMATAGAESNRVGQCLCPGTNIFSSQFVPGPILIAVMGCVFIALNSVWVFRIFFLKRSLCRSATDAEEPKYALACNDTTYQLRSKAQCYERLVDIYLSLHIHATLTVIIFFLLRMCLHTIVHGKVWNYLLEGPSTPVCKHRIVCLIGTLLLDMVVSTFWTLLLLSLFLLFILTINRSHRLLHRLCKQLHGCRRQTACAIFLHACPWFLSLSARLLHVSLVDRSLPTYLNGGASRSAALEDDGLAEIVQQLSAEERCARIGNSAFRLVEAILYTVPLLCVLPASALCLASVRKRQVRPAGNRQNTVLLYDLANGTPKSVADGMNSRTQGLSPLHAVVKNANFSGQRGGLQIGRLHSHPTYGSIALRLFGCLHSLTILASLCVSGLVVCGFRLTQTSLTGIEGTNLSDPTESLLPPPSPPPPPRRYDIIEKITNLLEILTIGLVYPLFSICLSTKRFSSDADVHAVSTASSRKYVCEPSVGFPAAQRRPSQTMAAGSGFVKPKSQIPAKALLEIPTYTRCQFYGSLKTDDKHERVIVEPTNIPDSVLVPLDNCEIK